MSKEAIVDIYQLYSWTNKDATVIIKSEDDARLISTLDFIRCELLLFVFLFITFAALQLGALGSLLCFLPADVLLVKAWTLMTYDKRREARDSIVYSAIFFFFGVLAVFFQLRPEFIVVTKQ